MTPQEVLDRIAALCDDAESGDYPTLPAKIFVRTVRKVLADVTTETGCTLDRDDLRALLDERFRNEHEADDDDVDSIIRLIEPVPGVTLTPEDAARTLLWWAVYREEGFPGVTDAALVARLEATQ